MVSIADILVNGENRSQDVHSSTPRWHPYITDHPVDM
jgi:hypothetical protein